MKVGTNPNPPAQPRNPATRQTPTGARFAELLESGARAAQVVSSRALGFDETGLLGLHFAGPTRGDGAVAAPVGCSGGAHGAVPALAADGDGQVSVAVRGAPEAVVARPSAGQAGAVTASLPPLDDGQATEGPPISGLPEPGSDPACPPGEAEASPTQGGAASFATMLRAQCGPKVRMARRGAGWVVSITIDGGGEDPEAIARIVHVLASEYGVTVDEVIVRPVFNPGPDAARQAG